MGDQARARAPASEKPLFRWRDEFRRYDLTPALRDGELKGKEIGSAAVKHVGINLSLYFDLDTLKAHPGLRRQARDTSLSRTTVAQALRVMERAGWIKRTRGKGRGEDGRWPVTQYVGTFPPDVSRHGTRHVSRHGTRRVPTGGRNSQGTHNKNSHRDETNVREDPTPVGDGSASQSLATAAVSRGDREKELVLALAEVDPTLRADAVRHAAKVTVDKERAGVHFDQTPEAYATVVARNYARENPIPHTHVGLRNGPIGEALDQEGAA